MISYNSVGLVLDKNGDAIGGGSSDFGQIEMYGVETFGGEDEGAVFFGNAEKEW